MSMQEIARRLGVSYTTISRSFNQPEKVRPETLQRVRKLCDELHYRPRVIPNNLTTVSVILSDDRQVEMADAIILSNTVSELNRQNMPTLVATMQSLKNRPTVFQRAFIGIMRRLGKDDVSLLRQYAKQGPFVAINDTLDDIGPHASRLASDHRGAMEQAIRHFEQRGHRRIGMICRQIEARGYNARIETFRRLLTERGLYDPALMFRNDDQFLLEGLRHICNAGPTALLIGDATLTLKVLHYLHLMGKQVPRDLSLMTMEYAGGTQYLSPAITALVQPLDELGQTAATMMLELLRGEPRPGKRPAEMLLPYRLIDRESVRPI
jgi:DNA-binding LacI/PurR family transcriptional regulator